MDYFGVREIYSTNTDGANPWFLGKGNWRNRSELEDEWFDDMTERKPRNELLISWQINADGSISRLADSGEQAGERAGEISLVSAVKLAPGNFLSKIVTAVSYDGDLKLISWKPNADGSISRLADSGGQARVDDSDGMLNGPICLVSAVPLSNDRVITAVRQWVKVGSGGTEPDWKNRLRLISWQINADGSITRLADSGEPPPGPQARAEDISMLSAVPLSNDRVITAVRRWEEFEDGFGNTLALILWRINSDGSITRLGLSDKVATKEDFDISLVSTVARFPNKSHYSIS